MDENEVESLRKDIGEKMARDKTDPLSPNASESVKQGYRRGDIGFGSNVTPRKFGKGHPQPRFWLCTCGHENPSNRTKKIAQREVCWQCEQDRSYVEVLDDEGFEKKLQDILDA